MDNREEIKKYIRSITNGLININTSHAEEIVRIATGQNKTPKAQLYRLNFQIKVWELHRIIKTTDEEIKKQLLIYKCIPENKDFYKYDLLNADGIYQGTIFAFDQFIFD